MSVKHNPNKPRFVPEALWLQDWKSMGSLLDDDAIQKLEQAGWTAYFARISDAGLQPIFGGERPKNIEELETWAAVDLYPVFEDLKQSEAARRLCELVKERHIHFQESQQGGWMSYADRHVAIFLPRYLYPPESAAEQIMAETDHCLAFVKPLREAQPQIADMIAQNPELGRKPEPTMSDEEAVATVKQMITDWTKKNGDKLDPTLELLTEPDLRMYQNLVNRSQYHPIDYLKDCSDNPDYLRVLAQARLIDEKRAAERKSKAEKPD